MQKTQSYLAAKLDTIRKKEAFKFIFDSVIADDNLMSSGVISEKIKATLLEERARIGTMHITNFQRLKI